MTELQFRLSRRSLYSSYLSGNGTDICQRDDDRRVGNIYVTGTTTSTSSQHDGSIPGEQFAAVAAVSKALRERSTQFFVTKVNTHARSTARALPYSTYFGGGDLRHDHARPVADGRRHRSRYQWQRLLHWHHELHLLGMLGMQQHRLSHPECVPALSGSGASGDDHRILRSCATTTSTTEPDAFVAKLNLNPKAAQGQQLVWSTYLGGAGTDSGTGVALDTGAANVYVVGNHEFHRHWNERDDSDYFGSVSTLSGQPVIRRRHDMPALRRLPLPERRFCGAADESDHDHRHYADERGAELFLLSWRHQGRSGTCDHGGFGQRRGGDGMDPVARISRSFPISQSDSERSQRRAGCVRGPAEYGAVVGQTTAASWANYFGGHADRCDEGTGVALDVNQNAYFAGDTNSTDLQVQKPLHATA